MTCDLVQITEQMERFDAHVGALDGALQETPEVLKAIGVDVPIDVPLGVVDHLMDVIVVQPLVGVKIRAVGSPPIDVRTMLEQCLHSIGAESFDTALSEYEVAMRSAKEQHQMFLDMMMSTK